MFCELEFKCVEIKSVLNLQRSYLRGCDTRAIRPYVIVPGHAFGLRLLLAPPGEGGDPEGLRLVYCVVRVIPLSTLIIDIIVVYPSPFNFIECHISLSIFPPPLSAGGCGPKNESQPGLHPDRGEAGPAGSK